MRIGTFQLASGSYVTSDDETFVLNHARVFSGELTNTKGNTLTVFLHTNGEELVNVPSKNVTNFIEQPDLDEEDEVFKGKPDWN